MTQGEWKKDCKNILINWCKCKVTQRDTLSTIELCVFKCVHNLRSMINIEIRADLKRIEKENYLNNWLLKNWLDLLQGLMIWMILRWLDLQAFYFSLWNIWETVLLTKTLFRQANLSISIKIKMTSLIKNLIFMHLWKIEQDRSVKTLVFTRTKYKMKRL